MKLKDLSEKSGISERTIRYYISDGLFTPERCSESYSGRKSYDYTENDLIRLKQIVLLRKYDFSIKEIKCLFDNELDIPKVLAEHIDDSKKVSKAYGENIAVMEQALKENPNNIESLYNALSNPVIEQAPIPIVDEQSGYKTIWQKWKKESLIYIIVLAACIAIMFISGLDSEKSFVNFKVIVSPDNIPDGTVYIDLLIPKASDEFFYTDNTNMDLFTLDDEKIVFSENSEIFTYCDENEYTSYSLHYKRALPVNSIKRDFGNEEYVLFYDAEFLLYSSAMKVAYVSKDGKVLSVTNSSTAKSLGAMVTCEGVKADGERLKPDLELNYSFTFGVVLFFIPIYCLARYYIERKRDM